MVNLRGKYIVYVAITLHYTWAALLLVSDEPLKTAPVSVFAFMPQYVASLVLAAIASGALFAVLTRLSPLHTLLAVIAQQLVLLLSAFRACLLIVSQHYADGVIRPMTFIGADQVIYLIVAVWYTVAILQAFRGRR